MRSQRFKFQIVTFLVFLVISSKGQTTEQITFINNKWVINVQNTKQSVVLEAKTFKRYPLNGNVVKQHGSVEDSTFVNINTNQNVIIDLTKLNNLAPIQIRLTQADTLRLVGGRYSRVSIVGLCDMVKPTNCISICNSKISSIDLSSFRVKSVILKNVTVLQMNLSNVKIFEVLSMYNTRLFDTKLDLADLPDTISLYTVKLETTNKNFDLTRIKNKEQSYNFERTLKISNTDLDKIDLNYGRFNFHVDPTLPIRNARWIYEKIIWHSEQSGLLSKVAYYKDVLQEIEDKDSKLSITNIVNSVWWSRGHNKSRAVGITFVVFFVFFLINCKFFQELKNVYYPKSIQEYFKRIDRIDRAFYRHPALIRIKWSQTKAKWVCYYGIFFYSGLIFWNIKIDIENLRLINVWLCFFILFQHLIGLLFIANIVGFIIVGH